MQNLTHNMIITASFVTVPPAMVVAKLVAGAMTLLPVLGAYWNTNKLTIRKYPIREYRQIISSLQRKLDPRIALHLRMIRLQKPLASG